MNALNSLDIADMEHIQKTYGLIAVLNDGEVVGFEKVEVRNNHIFYFSFSNKPRGKG